MGSGILSLRGSATTSLEPLELYRRTRSTSATRLASLDALRGAACLAVLLYHAINYGGNGGLTGSMPLDSPMFRAIFRVLDFGHLGVPLFFVLSGFCIHRGYASRCVNYGEFDVSFGEFMRRRVKRLYLPYLVALVLSMLLLVVAYAIGRRSSTLINYGSNIPAMLGLDFISHASMLHGLTPVFWKSGGNAVFWSLAVEWYFYLLYVPLIWVRSRTGIWTAFAGVVGIGFAVHLLADALVPMRSDWYTWLKYSPMVLWCQWMIGAVAAEAHAGMIRLPRWCSSLAMSAICAVPALYCELDGARQLGTAAPVFATVAAWVKFNPWLLAPTLWGLTFALLLNWCLSLDRAGRWPVNRFTTWLVSVGVFSYSLYLVHLPIRSTIRYALPNLTRTTSLGGYLIVATAIAVMGYTAGKVFYRLVERRCTQAVPPVAGIIRAMPEQIIPARRKAA